MVCNTSIKFYFVIFIFCLISHVFAFHMEDMIGGFPADKHILTYQVAIMGKLNYSNKDVLICSGAIIADDLILSSAQCFIDGFANLKELKFSIIAAIVDLKSSVGLKIDIYVIYIPDFDADLSLNDIAVAKLRRKLGLKSNKHLSKLEISLPGMRLTGKLGLVAAFGYDWVKTEVNSVTGKERRISGGSEYLLKYAFVRVVEDDRCNTKYFNINSQKEICGLMFSNNLRERWGLCTNDAGSPLIIENYIVGVASKNSPDCNDTKYGCIYTKVMAFAYFILGIIDGFPPNNTLVYYNRPHIPFTHQIVSH